MRKFYFRCQLFLGMITGHRSDLHCEIDCMENDNYLIKKQFTVGF